MTVKIEANTANKKQAEAGIISMGSKAVKLLWIGLEKGKGQAQNAQVACIDISLRAECNVNESFADEDTTSQAYMFPRVVYKANSL